MADPLVLHESPRKINPNLAEEDRKAPPFLSKLPADPSRFSSVFMNYLPKWRGVLYLIITPISEFSDYLLFNRENDLAIPATCVTSGAQNILIRRNSDKWEDVCESLSA